MKLIKASGGINGKKTMNIVVVGAQSDARSSERERLTGDLGTAALGDPKSEYRPGHRIDKPGHGRGSGSCPSSTVQGPRKRFLAWDLLMIRRQLSHHLRQNLSPG
ncbi:MAG: hypothetical protein ACO3KY_01700 [Lysobacterales bacterium]|jgi:hypothetical protein